MSSKIVNITITPENIAVNLKTELNINNKENSVNDIENILKEYFEKKEESEIEDYINECGGINNTIIYYMEEGNDLELSKTKKEIMIDILLYILPNTIYFIE